jgi:hypothetical protein
MADFHALNMNVSLDEPDSPRSQPDRSTHEFSEQLPLAIVPPQLNGQGPPSPEKFLRFPPEVIER